MVDIKQFFKLVEAYAELTGLAEATISKRLFNDQKRISMLRDDEGRDVGIRKVEKAVEWLSDNWPDGEKWPKDLPRPDVRKAS